MKEKKMRTISKEDSSGKITGKPVREAKVYLYIRDGAVRRKAVLIERTLLQGTMKVVPI